MKTSNDAGGKPVNPGPDAVYLARLGEGVFVIHYCEACSHFVFPPRVLCPYCSSPDLVWREPGGGARIYSTTVVRNKDAAADYNVALVDLDEGCRLMTRVAGIPPADVRIGMRVRASVQKLPEAESPILLFVPVEVE